MIENHSKACVSFSVINKNFKWSAPIGGKDIILGGGVELIVFSDFRGLH